MDGAEQEEFLRNCLVEEVALQYNFAGRSFRSIRAAMTRESGVDNHEVFFFVQAFLVHTANVSKLLWPGTLRGNRAEREEVRVRRDAIRAALGVTDSMAIQSRDARDTLEHYDERLEAWAKQTQRWNRVDMSLLPLREIIGIDSGDFHRNLEPTTARLSFRGDEYDLPEFMKELAWVEQQATDWLVQDRERRIQERNAREGVARQGSGVDESS
jgi:hypothetical protein